MTAQPHEPSPQAAPEKNLRAIRGALVTPEDREGFDEGLRLALAEVRTSLDLTKLNDFVHTWWLIACDSAKDPAGRQQMHERVANAHALAARGEALPRGDKSWRELLSERGVAL